MLSKNQIKHIKSLAKIKFRNQHEEYIAEGAKLINDLTEAGSAPKYIVATEEWLKQNPNCANFNSIQVKESELKSISQLKHPQQVLGVFKIAAPVLNTNTLRKDLTLVLDQIQDPGNFGTIIRIADWFGIQQIICIKGTVDLYNPKVVQATMGAISRVNIFYVTIEEFEEIVNQTKVPVYGTFLEGKNIHQSSLSKAGFIVMGNEGNGISNELKKLISDKLFIPSYPPGSETSESLNVSVATAITCSEFRRNS